MTNIKEAVISLIFSAVAIGLCELLIPKTSCKNQIRLITSVVLLISMISPFINGFEIPEFDLKSSESNVDYYESAEKSVAYAAKNEISEILSENNIEDAKIIINTGFDENNSIILDSVIILFDKKDKANINVITSQVKDKLKVNVEVGDL